MVKVNWREIVERLRGFDPAAVDYRNAGAWPLPVRAAALALVFALVLGVGHGWLLADGREQLQRMRLAEQALRRDYQHKAVEVASLPAYRVQQELIEAAFAERLSQLPGDAEIPRLLEDITRAAAETELAVRSIDLQPEHRADFYQELPMEIAVEGRYHNIGAFVSRVAGLSRIVTLHDFDLEAAPADGGLRLNVLAKTYRYVGQADDPG